MIKRSKIKNFHNVLSKILIFTVNICFVASILMFSINSLSSATEIDNTDVSNGGVEPDQVVRMQTNLGDVVLNIYCKELEKDKNVNIEIYTTGDNISTLYGELNYDEEVFERFNVSTDIETKDGWTPYVLETDEEGVGINLCADDDSSACSNELVATIHLTVKKVVDSTTIEYKNVYMTNTDYDDSLDDEGNGKDSTMSFTGNPEEPENPEEPNGDNLYLRSNTYKIGNDNIIKYETGDKYMSRISKETTREELVNKLNTNGTIKILKSDGTELKDEEFVGTGMTIEVSKDEEKISLKLAVMGDLDGNGKVTATDLSTLNQTILKLITLEEEYLMAADLDENSKITATDLSTENKILQKLI